MLGGRLGTTSRTTTDHSHHTHHFQVAIRSRAGETCEPLGTLSCPVPPCPARAPPPWAAGPGVACGCWGRLGCGCLAAILRVHLDQLTQPSKPGPAAVPPPFKPWCRAAGDLQTKGLHPDLGRPRTTARSTYVPPGDGTARPPSSSDDVWVSRSRSASHDDVCYSRAPSVLRCRYFQAEVLRTGGPESFSNLTQGRASIKGKVSGSYFMSITYPRRREHCHLAHPGPQGPCRSNQGWYTSCCDRWGESRSWTGNLPTVE